jgi:hypothetical protein
MSQASMIWALFFTIPIASGAFLSVIGLARKYQTARRYAYSSLAAWAYIIFSCVGALLIALILHAIGTRVIENEPLNCVLQGILSSGLFLGIISRISLPETNSEVTAQLKTIRDFIYEFLDDSIARQVMQSVESKIKPFSKQADKDRLLEEASRLIGGPPQLTAEQKSALIIEFDELASHGDFVSIVRILIRYYEVDYVVRELSGCIPSMPSTDEKALPTNQIQPT